jgi:hypothetical protein
MLIVRLRATSNLVKHKGIGCYQHQAKKKKANRKSSNKRGDAQKRGINYLHALLKLS